MTFVTATALTAAQLNTYVRDNTNFIYTPPGARVTRASGATAVASGGFVLYSAWDTARWNNQACWSAGTPDRFTAPLTAVYAVWACIEWANNTTGSRALAIQTGGSVHVGDSVVPASTGSNTTCLNVSMTLAAAAGTVIQMITYQDSGGSLNINKSGAMSPEFGIQWLSG